MRLSSSRFDCYIATLRNEIHRTSSPFNLLLSIRLSRRKSLEYAQLRNTRGTFFLFFFSFFPSQYNWFVDGRDTYFSNNIFKQFCTLIYSFKKSMRAQKKSEDFEIDLESRSIVRICNNNFLNEYVLNRLRWTLNWTNFSAN